MIFKITLNQMKIPSGSTTNSPSMQKKILDFKTNIILDDNLSGLPAEIGAALGHLGKVDEDDVAKADGAVAVVAELGGHALEEGGEVVDVAHGVDLLPAEGGAEVAGLNGKNGEV